MKIICTIIIILLVTTGAMAHEIVGTVTEVIDGDTFKTTEHGKPITIRISDIDCPELQQPGGQEAKQFTSNTLLGTCVSIKTNGYKQNGIISGKIITSHGKDMAVMLTQKGLAWPSPKTKNKLVTGQYEKAVSSKVGIWANGAQEPPWKYRQRTCVIAVKKKPQKRTSLYGDSVFDIARDPDGSAVGEGGGFTIDPAHGNRQYSGSSRTISRSKETYNKYERESARIVRNSSKTTPTSTPVRADSRTIRENCKSKWGENYRMIDYCIENQTAARLSVKFSGASRTIRNNCKNKWGTNYRMVKYCIENQSSAKSIVQHSSASGTIRSNCQQKWGTNYRMIKYCIENQDSAKSIIEHSTVSTATKHRCERKWGTNYRMVKYCIEH